jgi:predicted O-methyltransferase YrrM
VKGTRVAVEIGVWHGVNTRSFRAAMHPEGMLYAVDPFPVGRFGISWQKKIAHQEANAIKNAQIVWLEEYSNTAVDSFKKLGSRQIDFMFIDGDHSYEGVRTDWELWSCLVASNGVVALHDSRSYADRQIDHVGAARYTAEVIRKDPRFEVIDEVDSVTVVRRRGEV